MTEVRPTYLVTGASGFFGRYLTEDLATRGRVRAFDPLDFGNHPNVTWIDGDVRDAAHVRDAVAGCDIVVHNAALVPMTRSGSEFWEVNVNGTRNVLAACLETGVSKVLHISSSAIFGTPDEMPIRESTPRRPFDAYGRSKLAAEDVCGEFRERGLDISMIRPRPILGAGRLGIVEVLFDRVARGRPIYIPGRGNNRFQLVGVRDLLDACWAALEHPGTDYNVGAKEFDTLRADITALAEHAGTGSRVVGLPNTLVQVAMKAQDVLRLGPFVSWQYRSITHDWYYDTAKLEAAGWKAQDGNVEILCDTYDWYVNAPELSTTGSVHSRRVTSGLFGRLTRRL